MIKKSQCLILFFFLIRPPSLISILQKYTTGEIVLMKNVIQRRKLTILKYDKDKGFSIVG